MPQTSKKQEVQGGGDGEERPAAPPQRLPAPFAARLHERQQPWRRSFSNHHHDEHVEPGERHQIAERCDHTLRLEDRGRSRTTVRRTPPGMGSAQRRRPAGPARFRSRADGASRSSYARALCSGYRLPTECRAFQARQRSEALLTVPDRVVNRALMSGGEPDLRGLGSGAGLDIRDRLATHRDREVETLNGLPERGERLRHLVALHAHATEIPRGIAPAEIHLQRFLELGLGGRQTTLVPFDQAESTNTAALTIKDFARSVSTRADRVSAAARIRSTRASSAPRR